MSDATNMHRAQEEMRSLSKLVVTGWCRCGKTTLANTLKIASGNAELRVLDTDRTRGRVPFQQAGDVVARWFDVEAGPWIIEGVAAVRALRAWLATHPAGAPCDRVLFLDGPLVALTEGQIIMNKGLTTVWKQIEQTLRDRGVEVDVMQIAKV